MISGKTNIMLAEDDHSLAMMMKDVLEDEGYSVIYCRNGQEAIDKFNKHTVDMILLDIMMPVKDGFTVAKKVRQQSDQVPILFISTRGQEEDRIKGYRTGADDYIGKPFNMQELLMKIDVFLRRTRKMHADENVEFKLGTMTFSYTTLKLITPNETFDLTEKEADLLRFFCEHPNKIIKRNELLLQVWGKDDFFLGKSMNVYITKLRKFLKADESIVLETIHGIGYRLIF